MLIIINQVIIHFLPFWYGNPLFSLKLKYLKNNEDKYNTLFLGSSLIRRDIDPECFDKNTTIHTESFNLGTNGTFNPESYYIYDYLLKKDSLKSKYIFLELQNNFLFFSWFLHTTKIRYWLNPRYFIYSLKILYYSNRPKKQKITEIGYCFASFFEKHFNIELYQGLKTDYYSKYKRYYEAYQPDKREYNGYKPIETDNDINDLKARNLFLADTTQLTHRKEKSEQQFSNHNNLNFNKVFYEATMDLLERSKEKGYHIIFLLLPQHDNYDELLPILEKLPEENKIELANGNTYPELYITENTYSLHHLNSKGAKIFSKSLAEKFNELVEKHDLQ